jgi:hypothetical protein
MPIQLDFSNVESRTFFDQVPGGQYHCNIFDVEMRKTGPDSKVPGSSMIVLVLSVTDDKEVDGISNGVATRGNIKGQRFWANYPIMPESMWKLQELLVRLGWPADAVTGKRIEIEPNDLKGREVLVSVEATTWRGRPSNNVTDVFGAQMAQAVAAPAARQAAASGSRF